MCKMKGKRRASPEQKQRKEQVPQRGLKEALVWDNKEFDDEE